MSTPLPPEKLSFSLDSLSEVTGISVDILQRHIKANNLIARYPSSRPVIERADALAWLRALPTERPS